VIHVRSRSHRRRVLWPPVAAAGDWWDIAGETVLGAYAADDASSLANSYVNLNNPGVDDLTAGTAPTWAAGTGWTFNGTTQYLITPFLADAIETFAVLFANGGTGNRVLVGAGNVANTVFRMEASWTGSFRYYERGGYTEGSSIYTSGVMGIAGNQGYYNGATDLGAIPAGSGRPNLAMYIGAVNAAGSPTTFYVGDILKIIFFSTVLDATQMNTLEDQMIA
jgi:hypothetical protein